MSNIDMAKKLTAWAVGLSAGWITTNALRNNVNPESKLQKAEAVVGGIVVGSMVSDAASPTPTARSMRSSPSSSQTRSPTSSSRSPKAITYSGYSFSISERGQ